MRPTVLRIAPNRRPGRNARAGDLMKKGVAGFAAPFSVLAGDFFSRRIDGDGQGRSALPGAAFFGRSTAGLLDSSAGARAFGRRFDLPGRPT